jgi:hypothetical protein
VPHPANQNAGLDPEGRGSALRKPFHGTVSSDPLHRRLLQDNRNLGVAFQDATQKLVAENDIEKGTELANLRCCSYRGGGCCNVPCRVDAAALCALPVNPFVKAVCPALRRRKVSR